ncbi:MAG: AAA family ATPase [bacterium]
MITQMRIEGFKSFRKVDLKLGHLNLFVGTNASGKSNFLDALRILQGIGYGFTINEIFNGKPKSSASEVWEPIRGGSAKAAYIGEDKTEGGIINLSVTLQALPQWGKALRYDIGISTQKISVQYEKLSIDTSEIFHTGSLENPLNDSRIEVRHNSGKKGIAGYLGLFDKSKPIIYQLLRGDKIPKGHREVIDYCLRALSNTQNVNPVPTILRDYSRAEFVQRMGERGENFAALIKAIAASSQTKAAFVSWLQQLTPTEVDDVKILSGALGEPLFALIERNQEYPAPILSDGTLRFAAITAAFFQPDLPDILTIEEIENGIHPSRLRLLVELLKSQSKQNLQIIATTHSPIVLAWLKPEDYATTFLCKRHEQTGASVITPLNQIDRFLDLVHKHPIGDLFTEGWLEGVL